jgi:hypothetical protein
MNQLFECKKQLKRLYYYLQTNPLADGLLELIVKVKNEIKKKRMENK